MMSPTLRLRRRCCSSSSSSTTLLDAMRRCAATNADRKRKLRRLKPQPQPRTITFARFLSAMTAGVAFSEDLRGVLIFMHTSRFLDAKTISHWTGIPIRTIYRVLSTWNRTGEVKPAPSGKQGRPRTLDFTDTQVSLLIVKYQRHSPFVSPVSHGRCYKTQ